MGLTLAITPLSDQCPLPSLSCLPTLLINALS